MVLLDCFHKALTLNYLMNHDIQHLCPEMDLDDPIWSDKDAL